jgi:hypothetical protein
MDSTAPKIFLRDFWPVPGCPPPRTRGRRVGEKAARPNSAILTKSHAFVTNVDEIHLTIKLVRLKSFESM